MGSHFGIYECPHIRGVTPDTCFPLPKNINKDNKTKQNKFFQVQNKTFVKKAKVYCTLTIVDTI